MRFLVWFESSSNKAKSLRCIPRAELERLLGLAHCKIISSISNSVMDSYVLSESSLFVSDSRFLLKTCGRTTLLRTVEPLLNLAKDYCNLDGITNMFYSRKNFMRPELQPYLHQNFENEVVVLDKFFDDGAGYCLGRLNSDRWYLYTLNPSPGVISIADQTVEILMSDLDQSIMSNFTMSVSCTAAEARKLSGMDKLFPPDLIIDEKLFRPCGYSMNGILGEKDSYITVHITPEQDHSYVSFESNIRFPHYHDLVALAVFLFKPRRFICTIFAKQGSKEYRRTKKEFSEKSIPGFKMCDLQLLSLPSHALIYAQFQKHAYVNSAKKLIE
ncbi:unnamed protein product [Soboliphyme baturini]|uniref:adenosylmethionine decarboxylase n=1 Tax=Soboliphyme baturini TaxID=241478 RepID=A0A183IFF5_9BILA|nr:unnamed protein product [Soboliphyme baturini]